MSEIKNTFHYAEEAVVESVIATSKNGASLDITNLVVSFDIYEDVTVATLVAEVTIIDGLSLISKFPFIAEETIEIKFRSSFNENMSSVFMTVYKVSQVNEDKSDMAQMYTLYLCSPELIQNRKTKVSQSFLDRHDSIVSTIFREYFETDKTLAVEKTHDDDQVIIPTWNPFRAINWISSRSRRGSNPYECSYVFFERMDDGFYFVPLSALASGITKFKYRRSQPNFATVDGKKDIIQPIISLQEYNVANDYNQFESMYDGRYGSITNYYDPLRRTYNTEIYDGIFEYDKIDHVESSPPITIFSEYDDPSTYSNVGHMAYASDRTYTEDVYPQTILRRNGQLSQFKTLQTMITVAGNNNLHAGDVIELDIPTKDAPRDGNKSQDEYVSGRFIIQRIRHSVVQNQEYKSYMVLMRDSQPNPYPTTSTFSNNSEDNSFSA